MRKLGLNPDELKVQTFEMAADSPERGTVYGHSTSYTRCGSECNNCTFTNCYPDQRTEADCIC